MNEMMLQKMHAHAKQATANAYCHYSGLAVGACLLADDSKLYAGCNVENAVLGLTQCAEQNAVSTMISAGARKIQSILVVSSSEDICPPCVMCRQLLCEFGEPDMLIYLANETEILKTYSLAALLPQAFTKQMIDLI